MAQPSATGTAEGMSIEHSWPQSRGAAEEPAHSDLHHLFPVTRNSNSARNNFLYGDTACGEPGAARCRWETGGSRLGTPPYGGPLVFDVRPARQGDMARAQFYFAVRYRLSIDDTEEAQLRRWDEQDPPDDQERARNDAIFAVQWKRNPFVDRPELVARISDF
jgi:endonuclease I